MISPPHRDALVTSKTSCLLRRRKRSQSSPNRRNSLYICLCNHSTQNYMPGQLGRYHIPQWFQEAIVTFAGCNTIRICSPRQTPAHPERQRAALRGTDTVATTIHIYVFTQRVSYRPQSHFLSRFGHGRRLFCQRKLFHPCIDDGRGPAAGVIDRRAPQHGYKLGFRSKTKDENHWMCGQRSAA